jgi:adenine-specific DNA methylase
MFAGTGVVGEHFNTPDTKIISNDILYANYISLSAFLSNESYDESKISTLIDEFNNTNPTKTNYFFKNFSEIYFTKDTAKKIGYIREKIQSLFVSGYINNKEKNILLTSLIYSADKIANTVGHYDAFIQKAPKDRKFVMKMLDIQNHNNKNNQIHNKDANLLIRDMECDVLYLDPPYNSRQYSDAYHLLENLAIYAKPKVFGKAKKFDRTKIKSQYSKVDAPNALDDLIQNARCRYIMLSYNNTAKKGDARSHAKISDEQIKKSLSKRGEVKVFEEDFKIFSAKRNTKNTTTERIYFTKVQR